MSSRTHVTVAGSVMRWARESSGTTLLEAAKRINQDPRIDWGDLAGGAGYFDQAHFGHEFRRSPGPRRPGTSTSGGGSCANIPATRWTAGAAGRLIFQERQRTTR